MTLKLLHRRIYSYWQDSSLDIKLLSNGGMFRLSGPVMTRALTHLDNCYFIKSLKAIGYVCKTNTVSNTAFRGFGGPQGMLTIENILYSVSQYLKKPIDEIRKSTITQN